MEQEQKERMTETVTVEIERPQHYRMHLIETMDYIEDQDCTYAVGCAIKYLARYRFKGTPVQDLKKAVWYIAREIKRIEAHGDVTAP